MSMESPIVIFPVGTKVQRSVEKLVDGSNEIGEVIEVDGDRRRIQWPGSTKDPILSGSNYLRPKRTWVNIKGLRKL